MSRRHGILALVFLGIVISYVDRGNLSIAAPSIMRDFRSQPATMGVLLSAFFWTYGVFQLPAGAVVDRFGIRRTYAAGFLVWSLASASIALSRGPGDVVGMRMVLGLAESIGPLASLTWIRNNFHGREQGLPTAVYVAGQSVGPALGALAGSLLLDRFGWRMMFGITGLGAMLWLPCWWFAMPSDGTHAAQPRENEPENRADSPALNWRALFASPTFWSLSLCILLSSYYWYFVLTWVPTYLTLSRGFSTTEMGRVVSTGLFTVAVTNVISGYAADKLAARIGVFRSRLIFAAVGYVGTAAILLLLVVRDRAWVLPILTFAMCATGTGNSCFWAIVQHVTRKDLAGRTIGYLNTLSQIAGAAAPLVTGWLLGPQKQFGPAILVAGVCPVLAAICLLANGASGLERTKALLTGRYSAPGIPGC
jgi:MFS family permease